MSVIKRGCKTLDQQLDLYLTYRFVAAGRTVAGAAEWLFPGGAGERRAVGGNGILDILTHGDEMRLNVDNNRGIRPMYALGRLRVFQNDAEETGDF